MSEQQWTNKRVLVTGGAGFIASHLVEALVDAGAHVTIIDLFTSGRRENLQRCIDRVELREQDMRALDWVQVLNDDQFDNVFHMAANAYVPPSVADPVWDYQVNCQTTLDLVEAMRKVAYPGVLIYASSAAVYGNPARIPVTEEDRTYPISPYGAGKLAAERYVAVYSQLYNIRAASLRLFSIYGPRQRKQVVYDLMERITQNRDELFIHGDGTQERDFGYVEDVARAAMTVAANAPLQGEVYNVGAGRGISIDTLARLLCGYLDASPRFVYSGSVRPGDPEKLVVNIDKLKSLGYEPQVMPEEGVRRTVDWFKKEVLENESALLETR